MQALESGRATEKGSVRVVLLFCLDRSNTMHDVRLRLLILHQSGTPCIIKPACGTDRPPPGATFLCLFLPNLKAFLLSSKSTASQGTGASSPDMCSQQPKRNAECIRRLQGPLGVMRGKFSRCNVEHCLLDIFSFTSDYGADATPKIKDVISVTLGMCSVQCP